MPETIVTRRSSAWKTGSPAFLVKVAFLAATGAARPDVHPNRLRLSHGPSPKTRENPFYAPITSGLSERKALPFRRGKERGEPRSREGGVDAFETRPASDRV